MSDMKNWVNMCVTKDWREMGAWGMKMGDGSWIIIDITDTHLFKDLSSGEGVANEPRYFSRIRRIALKSTPKSDLKKAVKACGFSWDKTGIKRESKLDDYIPGVKFIGNKVSPEHEETVIVDSCVQSGLGDILWEESSDDSDRLRELAKRKAYDYIRNPGVFPDPREVAEFNKLLAKHEKKPMFPLSNILPTQKTHVENKPKILN